MKNHYSSAFLHDELIRCRKSLRNKPRKSLPKRIQDFDLVGRFELAKIGCGEQVLERIGHSGICYRGCASVVTWKTNSTLPQRCFGELFNKSLSANFPHFASFA